MGFEVNGNAFDCYPALWMWLRFVSIAAGETTGQAYKAVVLRAWCPALSFQSPQILV